MKTSIHPVHRTVPMSANLLGDFCKLQCLKKDPAGGKEPGEEDADAEATPDGDKPKVSQDIGAGVARASAATGNVWLG
eukprot:gene10638-biopygen15354